MSAFQMTFFSGSGIQAILSFVIGAVFCFFGYKFRRFIVPAGLGYMGFTVGLTLAGRFITGGFTDLIAGILGMAGGAVLAIVLPRIGFSLFAGLIAGNAVKVFTGNVPAVVLTAVFFGVLSYVFVLKKKRPAIIAFSALAGSVFSMTGLFGMLGIPDAVVIKILWFLICLVLAGIGGIAQTMMNGKEKKKPKKPEIQAINI